MLIKWVCVKCKRHNRQDSEQTHQTQLVVIQNQLTTQKKPTTDFLCLKCGSKYNYGAKGPCVECEYGYDEAGNPGGCHLLHINVDEDESCNNYRLHPDSDVFYDAVEETRILDEINTLGLAADTEYDEACDYDDGYYR